MEIEFNNFKKLLEEEEQKYEEKYHDHVRSGIWQTLGVFRLVGNIIDIFLSKLMGIIIIAAGGNDDSASSSAADPTQPQTGADPGKTTPDNPEHPLV